MYNKKPSEIYKQSISSAYRRHQKFISIPISINFHKHCDVTSQGTPAKLLISFNEKEKKNQP